MRNGEFVKGQPVPGTRYRVVDLVGAGGMGSVYEVEHLELGKRFMLKALLSDLALRQDLVARLRNEQRALGRLEHPNIVAVTDAGVTSGNATRHAAAVWNNQVYLAIDSGLWKSDGTAAGTVQLTTASSFGVVAGETGVLFGAGDAINGTELWKSDGTAPAATSCNPTA